MKRKVTYCFLGFICILCLNFGACKKPVIPPAPPVDETGIIATMDVPEKGTPKDYTPFQNMAIAAGIIQKATSYESIMEGNVKAVVMLGIPADQQVLNRKVVKNNMIFTESKSYSMFKKVAEQKFFVDDKIFFRDSRKITSLNDVIWSNTADPMSYEDHLNSYGPIPRGLSKYVLKESTIKESKTLTADNNTFKYEFNLKDEAAVYMKNEMRTLGGADGNPQIKSVKITLTIDKNWYPICLEIKEVYKIKIKIIGDAECSTSSKETFSKINNESLSLPELDFFKNFID